MLTCPQCSQRYPDGNAFCFVDGATLEAQSDPLVGLTIAGRYVVHSAAGEAGLYRAHHKLVGIPCSLWVWSAQSASEGARREAFLREAADAERVVHPGLLATLGSGVLEDGGLYAVIDEIKGAPLAEVLKTATGDLHRLLPLFGKLARALGRAHAAGVVHGAIGMGTVFVDEGDEGRLLGLGLSAASRTPMEQDYAAPELASGSAPTVSSDLYALGALLFHAVAGKAPFEGADPADLHQKQVTGPTPRILQHAPDCPKMLDQLLLMLLSPDPAARPVSAQQVLKALTIAADKLFIVLPESIDAPRGLAQPTGDDDLARWAKRLALFDKMLEKGFGASPPPDLVATLQTMKGAAKELGDLRSKAREQLTTLEAAEAEDRAGKVRFMADLDAAGAEAAELRDRARIVENKAKSPASAPIYGPKLHEAHREVITWEGRCGFAEPHPELVKAYRLAADIVEQWHAARAEELTALSAVAESRKAAEEANHRLEELRAALDDFTRTAREAERPTRTSLAEIGQRAELLEDDLIHRAGRFCAPLRAKPELGTLFHELELTSRV